MFPLVRRPVAVRCDTLKTCIALYLSWSNQLDPLYVFPWYFSSAFSRGRHVGGAFGDRGERRPRVMQPGAATAVTRLHAKATYKNFEDMLEKEPGALLVDFYAT